MAAASPLATIMASPKQAPSDVFAGSRKHVITSPQTSPQRPVKRECIEHDLSLPPATPTSLPKGRKLNFSPADSPSRVQRVAEPFTTASQSAAGVAAMAALRMQAPIRARPAPPTSLASPCLPLGIVSAQPVLVRPVLVRSRSPVPLTIIREQAEAKAVNEEVDELDGEEIDKTPMPSPSLSPSFFAAELARLHPLLSTCASPLAKAGVPDLATLRTLRRDELETFLTGVDALTQLQRTLLISRASSSPA